MTTYLHIEIKRARLTAHSSVPPPHLELTFNRAQYWCLPCFLSFQQFLLIKSSWIFPSFSVRSMAMRHAPKTAHFLIPCAILPLPISSYPRRRCNWPLPFLTAFRAECSAIPTTITLSFSWMPTSPNHVILFLLRPSPDIRIVPPSSFERQPRESLSVEWPLPTTSRSLDPEMSRVFLFAA